MNRDFRYHGLTVKDFLLPGLFLLFSFIIVGHLMIVSIQNHYYEHQAEVTSNLAQGYASGMSRALAADDIVNEMLTDKILTVSETLNCKYRIVRAKLTEIIGPSPRSKLGQCFAID